MVADSEVEEAQALIPSLSRFPEHHIQEMLNIVSSCAARKDTAAAVGDDDDTFGADES
jgi:hypothetical protein